MSTPHGMHFERGLLKPNTMNPIRSRLLSQIRWLVEDYRKNTVANHSSLMKARDLNQEFIERSRGKGKH